MEKISSTNMLRKTLRTQDIMTKKVQMIVMNIMMKKKIVMKIRTRKEKNNGKMNQMIAKMIAKKIATMKSYMMMTIIESDWLIL